MVTDPSGAAVPKATVVCKNLATNNQRQTVTDSEGLYRAPNLEPGEYVIEVEAAGFRRTSSQPARLDTAGVLRIDLPLEVGQVADSLTVTASAIEVNTEDPQLGETLRQVSSCSLGIPGGTYCC